MLENTRFGHLSSVEGRPILGQAVRIRDGAPGSFGLGGESANRVIRNSSYNFPVPFPARIELRRFARVPRNCGV